MKHELPDLPYDYKALEPVISAEIMELHHKKHHAGYVAKLNEALDAYSNGKLEDQIGVLQAIKFNGGGHINHSLFWENLCPEGEGTLGDGALKSAIESKWGSLDGFIEKFNAKVGPLQGSGWGWLVSCPGGGLCISLCQNQDPVCASGKMVPLLGIDVWEHAYYLQYKNARPEYLKNIWKVINWKKVEERYNSLKR